MLKDWIKDNVDILLISETKLNEFFSICYFKLMASPLPTEETKIKMEVVSKTCHPN